MTVNNLDGVVVGDGDMVGRNSDHLAVFHVCIMDGIEATSAPSLQKQPEVGEGGEAG